MAGFDDDFGELYSGVDVPVLSAVNSAPQFDQSLVNSSHKQQIDSANIDFSSDDSSGDERLRMNDDKLGEEKILGFCDGGIKSESENEDDDDDDDDDDDFVVVVNRDEDVRENVEVDNVVSETNLIRNARGGDVVGNLTKSNCGNSQYKYVRRLGSVSMGTERATGPRRVDKDYSGRFQQNSIRCRVEPAGDGSTELNFGDLRNGFCLPWYRTIVDVDIDSLEQKPWTNSGADMTDYFNFGFDEDSWRSYCQSLDQLRHQSFNLARNQGYRNLRCNPVGASKQLDLGKFAERDSDACGKRRIPSQELCLAGKVGQPIHVEDSNFERQPSTVSRPPRICDSDVIIEVTLQEPEEPSKLPEEPDDKLEASFDIVEKRCEQGKLVQETQLSGDLKANKMRQICVEENVSSPTQSSDLRRSYEPAAVSNGTSCTQTQRQNTESDSRKSGKMYTLSGGNQRAPNIAKDDAGSDRDSIATNPCVAGLDLLSDEADVQSSDTSSYSLSKESNGDYYNDSIKTRSCGKSSPESVVVRSQVVRVDYHSSRDSKRGDTGRKGSCHKYHSRVRRSTEEDLKSSQKNFCRHSEMKNHTLDVDIPKHVHASSRSRFLYEDEERRGAANFINDSPSYWEKSYSSKRHYKHFMKSQLHDEWKEDSNRQDHWGFRDDISSNTRRRWDDDQHCSERTRRMRGDMNNRDRDLDKREFVCRRGNHLPHNEPHSTSKYCASADIKWQSRYGDYHDDRLNKTSKHAQSEEYRYSDMSNRYADSPLNDWQREHMESEIEHQRHLNFFGKETRTFDRGDNVFEQLSSDYSRFIKDDNEYHNGQAFPDIYDYHDEQHVHAERWGYSSLSKDDADIHQTCNKNERNCGYLYAKKRSNVRRPTDSRDAYDRDKCQSYLDHDDFFVNGRYTSQSEGMDWQDDALLESNIYNDVDEMFNSVNGIRRHKLYGAKNGLVSNDMLIYAKSVKDDYGVICAGGKSYNKKSKILTRAKHERTGWRCRNSVGLRDFKGNKSCGSLSKPGTSPNNDARSHVGDFGMHLKEQPLLDASFSEKSAGNEALKVEKSQTNHCHLEDGQILTEDVRSKKFVSGHQKSVNQNVSRAYDESRILATMAKMEKRRERFKQPILVRKDGDDIPNPQVVKSAITVEFKAQRPTRKRQWGWNLGV